MEFSLPTGYHCLALEGDGHPCITVQPFSQTVAAGATVWLQAMAAGLQPLNYQWQRNGTNLAGATSTLLTLAGVQYSDTGAYTLLISNSLGAAASAAALLSVQAPPVLTVQPSAQTVLAGSSVAFSAEAVGSPSLSYQWRLSGSNIFGATLSGYTVATAQPADAGDYSVVVTNAFGAAVSSNATLTVLVKPNILSEPANQTVIAGTDVTFSVGAAGSAPLSYQWFFNGTSLLSGATADTLNLPHVQPAAAGVYSAVVSNVVGVVTSSVVSLTVLVPPAIASQPSSQTVVVGTDASFGVKATGTTPLNYQWTFGGAPLAGATADTLLLTGVQAAQAGGYAVVVTNLP